jgi:exopolyphosphatase/guanosine-5'-triphosphate,3'-diphosphate pyrophosphatase
MVLAIVDVGSNTVRLLVARRTPLGLERLYTDKVAVGLGADVEELGEISDVRRVAARKAVRRLCDEAHAHGAESIEVLVTSPGRQAANAEQLLRTLERAAGVPVRVLSQQDEAELAYAGAVASVDLGPGLVAVCDMGGASTELAVGIGDEGPSWLRSADLGALRLTTRCGLGEQPTRAKVNGARDEVRRAFQEMLPPLPVTALAVGGSARALQKLVGPTLGEAELEEAIELLANKSFGSLGRRYGIRLRRLRLLLGGALILADIQRRVIVPLEVAEAGVREGAILATADRLAA